MHNHDRKVKAGMVGFAVMWVISALMSIAFTALIIWGLWEGVMWLRSN